MRAVVYLRISEDRTGREAGVTRQREDCLRRCRERGWDLDDRIGEGVFCDNDLEATTGRKRAGFEAVLTKVEDGYAGVVVAWQLDRLQRNKRDEVRLYEACRAKNAIISLAMGPDLDLSTAVGRLLADQLGLSARFEVEVKSERQVRANEQARAEGRWVGGRRPFGYEPDGVTVRAAERDAVEHGLDLVLSGASLPAVARAWNAAGLPTGQGNPWVGQTVRPVLTSPRYVGLMARRVRTGPRRGWVWEVSGPAQWPAAVPEAKWRAVQEVLADPARRSLATSGRALLSGLGLCGVPGCGSTVRGGRATRGGHRTYRCRDSAHLCRAAEPVDTHVGNVVCERLSRKDAASLYGQSDRPDATALRVEAAGVRRRLGSLAALVADEVLTEAEVRVEAPRLRARLTAVQLSLADAGRVDLLGPLVQAADVRAAWKATPTARKRLVVDALMVVTLDPPGRGRRATVEAAAASVRIEWRQPG